MPEDNRGRGSAPGAETGGDSGAGGDEVADSENSRGHDVGADSEDSGRQPVGEADDSRAAEGRDGRGHGGGATEGWDGRRESGAAEAGDGGGPGGGEEGLRLCVARLRGPARVDEEVDGPTPQDMIEALARLDGRACTELTLTQGEPFAVLGIGGGPELYLVTGESAAGELVQLLDPGAPSGVEVDLVCGGQLAAFPRRGLVGRGEAARALLHFLRFRDFDRALPWDMQ